MTHRATIAALALLVCALALWQAEGVKSAHFRKAAPQQPDRTKRLQFNRDVRPILSDSCFACHGPDKSKRKVGLRLDDVGLGGILGGDVGGDVRLRGGDVRLLGIDRGLRLDALDSGEDGALLHMVALFHIKVSDAPHGCGAQIDVGLGLDLPGPAHDRRQILPDNLRCQHLGVA